MRQVSISEYNSTWISNETEGRTICRGECQLTEYKQEIEQLREALADLVAIQNGPPLVTYIEAWNEAMEKAYAALKDNP